jgi:very-short-patch-repair endonuclease
MDNFFYNFFITDNKSGYKTKEIHLLNKYPDIHKKIYDFCDNEFLINLPFNQKVWHFIYQEKNIKKCKECGSELKFKRSLKEGYGEYCSIECTNKNKEHIEKVKTTNKERWGGVSPIHSDDVKNKIKTTNKERWGVENVFQRLDLVSEGFIRNHGVNHVSKVDGVTEKKKLTNMEKYGKPTILSTPSVLNKTHDTRRKYFIERYNNFNFTTYTGDTLTILCDECNQNYDIHRNSFRYRVSVNVNPCTICNPINEASSIQEKELQKIVSDIVGDCILNDRTTIPPKELDIVIPNKKLGIEYNGVYWHNELFVEDDYHLKKYLSCKSKGFDLIQIFQDEWETKRDIVLSLIKNRLGYNTNNVIYARKCEIKFVTNKEHNQFLNVNHVQGKVGASVKLGLYYNDELVSLMTFGKLRKSLGSSHVDGEWELIRFCNKLNHNVVGGASKLFKYFVKNYNPIKILSFSDNRFFNGDMYKLLGFGYDGYSKPSYFYVINGLRHHRYNFRKDVLVREGFDSNKTEHQIMLDRGIYRIYDCGNKRWLWVDETKINN